MCMYIYIVGVHNWAKHETIEVRNCMQLIKNQGLTMGVTVVPREQLKLYIEVYYIYKCNYINVCVCNFKYNWSSKKTKPTLLHTYITLLKRNIHIFS